MCIRDSYSGGIMLECEVNPADVVSIPVDYDQAKMRVCKYKVLGAVDREHSSDLSLRVTSSCCSHHDEDDCEEEEEEDDGFHECAECGGECEEGYDVCQDCEDNLDEDEEEEEEEEDEEDEDEYPWDEELD